MAVIVVSDTSVLMNLAAIGQLHLLRLMFVEVIIPEAVRKEMLAGGQTAPGFSEVAGGKWIQSRAVENRELVSALTGELDAGEAEAIALAKELNAALLIDERRGAAVADRLGIFHTGLIGVLLRAKRDGHVPAVRPLLEQSTKDTSFRMSDAVIQTAIHLAMED